MYEDDDVIFSNFHSLIWDNTNCVECDAEF